MKYLSMAFLLLINFNSVAVAQKSITKSIRSFGAKGDGKTNDTEAFLKATAFFNERGGNGTLTIPKGIYIIGQQKMSNGDENKYAYTGDDILSFTNCNNLVVKGEKGSELKYADKLKFGSFDPLSGKIFNDNDLVRPLIKYAGVIGSCITLTNCTNVTITTLSLNGNNKAIKFGGRYGDMGIQLMHVGIYVKDSHSVLIDKITASYFGLDGIMVSNKPSATTDDIRILNSTCAYNCRQGLSWVGGNFLIAKNCKFNHTGKAGNYSAPCAGVDIEAEVGPISGGLFDACEFIDNYGCGVVTGGGKASDCQFTNCTFWGTTNWSIWVTMPRFTFTDCKIYGSIVHGFNSENETDATRYIKCYFEDKPYRGKPPYGKFIIECDGPRKLLFDSCTFTTNTTRIAWLNTGNATAPTEKATIKNSHFIIKKTVDGNAVFWLHNINFKKNTVEFMDPAAKQKGFWVNPCCITPEDKDATKIIYNK